MKIIFQNFTYLTGFQLCFRGERAYSFQGSLINSEKDESVCKKNKDSVYGMKSESIFLRNAGHKTNKIACSTTVCAKLRLIFFGRRKTKDK